MDNSPSAVEVLLLAVWCSACGVGGGSWILTGQGPFNASIKETASYPAGIFSELP